MATTLTPEGARQQAVDAFFAARPGWSRFNLEPAFLKGWDNRAGSAPQCRAGGYLANTVERNVYTAGRLDAAAYLARTMPM